MSHPLFSERSELIGEEYKVECCYLLYLEMNGVGEPEPFFIMVTHAGLKLRHLLSQSCLKVAVHSRNNKAARLLSRLGLY